MSRKKIRRRFKLIRKKKLIDGYFLLELLIQRLMKKGKKILIKRYINNIIQKLKEQSSFNFSFVIEEAIKNISPTIKITSKFLTSSQNIDKNISSLQANLKTQFIVEISSYEATKTALNWLIQSAKMRDSTNLILSLTLEILEAFKKKGNAIKKRLALYEKAKFLKANKTKIFKNFNLFVY